MSLHAHIYSFINTIRFIRYYDKHRVIKKKMLKMTKAPAEAKA